jgi:formamidopyrimidine-DNA glycosylase
MPELPEVETMRRGILAAVGSRIADVEKLRCPRLPIEIKPTLSTFRRRTVRHTITRIDRVGKRVVIRLDSDDAIVIEPRMTGLVLVSDAPTREHLRVRLALTGGPLREIYYWDRRGLGSVRLFSAEEFSQQFGPEKIGPDALLVTGDLYHQRLAHSTREVKVALLDQRAVAGIGNLYAAEILHLAKIHPQRRCNELTKRHWHLLADATHQVLELAIRYEGSTLSDGTYRNALNKAGGYQNEHRVYDRAGQPCPRCKRGKVERIVQCQRATFFCGKCQK